MSGPLSNTPLPLSQGGAEILPESITKPVQSVVTPSASSITSAASKAPAEEYIQTLLSQFSSGTSPAPEEYPKIIDLLPQLFESLEPEQKGPAVDFITMAREILDALFSSEDPAMKKVLDSFMKEIFTGGKLSQFVAKESVKEPIKSQGQGLQSEQTGTQEGTSTPTTSLPTSIKNTLIANLKEQIKQTLIQTAENPEQPQSAGSEKPMQKADELTLKLPAGLISEDVPENAQSQTAELVATSTTEAIAEFLTQNFPELADAQETSKNELKDALTTIIDAQVMQTDPESNPEVLISIKPDNEAETPSLSLAKPQEDELSKMQENFAKIANMDIAAKNQTLQKYLQIPEKLQNLLTNLKPEDQAAFLLLKTAIANLPTLQLAVLRELYEKFQDKFEFLKPALTATFAEKMIDEAKQAQKQEQMQKLQEMEQILLNVPALLNTFVLNDLKSDLEDDLEKSGSSALYLHKFLLFNAAHEVITIASGNPTAEYSTVGLMHEQLGKLSQKLQEALPKNPEGFKIEQMENVTDEIKRHFSLILMDGVHTESEILKRHPRTLLYLLFIRSPLADEFRHRSFALSISQDSYFDDVLNLVHHYEDREGFAKYQPHVLERFVYEAKNDTSSDLSKNRLKIVHRALTECADFIDLE